MAFLLIGVKVFQVVSGDIFCCSDLLRDVVVRVVFRYYDVMSQVLLTLLNLYCDILTAMFGFEFLL